MCVCVQGYQRLEFLGDAVLDLLMTRYYFTTYRCAHNPLTQPSHPVSNATAMGRMLQSVEKLHCCACYMFNHDIAPDAQHSP